MTEINSTKALEFLANEMLAKGLSPEQIAKQMHDASFLATIEGVSEVLGSRATPTPLYRISYNPVTNSLDFTFLEGRGKVPLQNAVDIDVADLIVASLQTDRTPLLFEGVTGTGKTYTLENVLEAVYTPRNRRGLRLNPNMSNVLQPYITGSIDNGVLRININREAARQVAALFVDEQNRGDTNAVLGLLDNQVALPTGERAELGLPIPQIKADNGRMHVTYDEGKSKPVAVYSAQNPSSVEYSGARSTDGAVGNRQVRVTYPNMSLSSGAATLNMAGRERDHHQRFIEIFSAKLAEYLRADKATLDKILLPQGVSPDEEARANGEYLALHAFSFDPRLARSKFLKSAVEGADHLVMLTAGEGLAKNFAQELDIAADWTNVLNQYGVNFTYGANFDSNSQVVSRIDAVRAALKDPLIERDKTKATKIAEALALISWYKQAYENARERRTSPMEEFVSLQTPLTLKDIASSYAIVLNDKMIKNGVSPVSVINQAFTDYVNVLEGFKREVTQEPTTFDMRSPNMSIRYLASYLAVDAIKKDKNLNPNEYATKMVDAINKAAAVLRGVDGGIDTRKLLVARANADLASLAGFIHQYRTEITDAFNKVPGGDKVIPRYNALAEIVIKARSGVKTNYTLPRVERIFGI
jgi:hypothetical protein